MYNPQCEQVVQTYLKGLTDDVQLETTDQGCLVVTPFLLPDGDYVEVSVINLPDGTVRFTDEGETINSLWLNGLSLSRSILEDIRRIGRLHGVSVARNELIIQGDEADNPLHRLIQAIQATAALIEKRRPFPRLDFNEEVEATIIASGNTYDSPYTVSGREESHTVRFHLDGNRRILAQPLSPATEQAARVAAERSYYLFDDILNHTPGWNCFALLDDRGNKRAVWTDRTLIPLRARAKFLLWSEGKQEFLDALVASA